MKLEIINKAVDLHYKLKHYERSKEYLSANDINLFDIIREGQMILGEAKMNELIKPFQDMVLKLIDDKGASIMKEIEVL